MKKSKASFILTLVLMLSLIIAPVTQAMEDRTIDQDELLIVDENNVINYNELRTDTIQRLSEIELQKLKDKIVSDYINRNPDAVLKIPLTDAQMRKVTKQKETDIEELILRKQIQLDKQSKVESINLVQTKYFRVQMRDFLSSLIFQTEPKQILVRTERVGQMLKVITNVLVELVQVMQ